MNRKSDNKIWGIFVQGMQDQAGNGYFRACLESETDDNKQPLDSAVCSTSKVGFFAAAINLCKRLDRSKKHSFPETPAKWGIYFVNAQAKIPMINHGYLLVEENSGYGSFTAHLMGLPW